MEMTTPKMKSPLMMNLVEVLTTIVTLLLMTKSLVHLMKSRRYRVHDSLSIGSWTLMRDMGNESVQ